MQLRMSVYRYQVILVPKTRRGYQRVDSGLTDQSISYFLDS